VVIDPNTTSASLTDGDLALEVTPAMRERADAVVEAMRARWVAKDAQTDLANRAFDVAFRRALRQTRNP